MRKSRLIKCLLALLVLVTTSIDTVPHLAVLRDANAATTAFFSIVPPRESLQTGTDFDSRIGVHVENRDDFIVTCREAVGTIPVTVTSDNPNFTLELTDVACGVEQHVVVTFTPTAPGVATARFTISSSYGSHHDAIHAIYEPQFSGFTQGES
jgi:hypothetical protein